ncbi:TetR/AcrR family transcriptional regulator [Streptosporangium saharense]|uniref:AcrR family transcriptional regulator n=1 Tax=Streptosporangium saharense TaxID=1706840 RepID=A0A7W7QR49_9ACTN|nr:TetR family transcriptional regulator [Streptosporangium saharense]MBB4918200.1 AcrR family transcriptional regulator [Streptosporangium saharense]
MSSEPGLRERKKQQTRQTISDIASGLFLKRGFDNVTVAEVAEAAGVSAKTVFNYFPRKEDLFLDRFPEAAELIIKAIRERPEGEEPLAALRRLQRDLMRANHPFGTFTDGYRFFWQVVIDSPSLQARAREWAAELEGLLGSLLAEATGASQDDPWPRVAAAMIVSAYRTVYVTTVDRVLAGEPAQKVARDHTALLERAFDCLERALALPEGRYLSPACSSGPEGGSSSSLTT